jgi:hypothetical protein
MRALRDSQDTARDIKGRLGVPKSCFYLLCVLVAPQLAIPSYRNANGNASSLVPGRGFVLQKRLYKLESILVSERKRSTCSI